MSPDRSKLRDVAVLADEEAQLTVDFDVRELGRLVPELADDSGTARGELRFVRDHGFPAADVIAEAELTLTCQRCMQPVKRRVKTESRVVFPPDEASAERLPAEVETMLAPEGRLRLADVLGEELLLALPLSPRHAGENGCGDAGATGVAAEEEQMEVQRPFAALAELMSRKDSG
jgi:uncharacterized protein